MLTKEFTGLVSNASGLSKKETEHLLSTMNAVIRENLMSGNTIQLQGLGTLEIKERSERTIVHPRTGERSVVPAKSQVVFKPVAALKDTLKKI